MSTRAPGPSKVWPLYPDLVSPLEENWAGRRIGNDLSILDVASGTIFIVEVSLIVRVYGENL